MDSSGNRDPIGDPFSKFWTDMMSRMPMSGFPGASASAGPDVMKQMRQSFFESWARYCDEFMRSEQFLEGMKKGMDSALAFKQQVNGFLTKCLHDGQMPARNDTDSILLVLRSLEERIVEKVDRVARRVDEIEARLATDGAGGAGVAAAAAKTKKGVAR